MSKRICIFGASETHGAFDKEKGGWANRFRLYLYKEYYREYSTYILGVSGDTTELLLKRMKSECDARQPHVIIIAIGKNDSASYEKNGVNWVSPVDYAKNLNELVEISKKFTKSIIFVGLGKINETRTMPAPFGEKPYYQNDRIIKYNSIIERVCRDNNLLFIPIYDLLSDKDLDDGLHPNAKGHEKIFQRIKSYLIKNKVF